MTRIQAAALIAVMALAAACADTTVDTTIVSATPSTVPPTTEPAAVTPGDITVTAEGSDWVVPAAVCLRADGDPAAVEAAARAEGATIHHLVAQVSSGWPTTTAAPDFGAAFEEGMALHGPLALALGDVAGITDEIVADWMDLEAGYATAEFDPPNHVELRLDGWRATAAAVVAAIGAACAG